MPTASGSQYAAIDGQTFYWSDDMVSQQPEDFSGSPPAGWPGPWPPGRPRFTTDTTSGAAMVKGDYSWFVTLSNSPADQSLPQSQWTHYMASVVVCYKRNFPATAGAQFEKAVQVANFYDAPTQTAGQVALSGGSITLVLGSNSLPTPINDDPTSPPGTTAGITVKENDWVALCSKSTGLCTWYRVVAIGDTSGYLTLNGPDWVLTGQDYVVALGKSVVGVYTVPIELDQDPAWR